MASMSRLRFLGLIAGILALGSTAALAGACSGSTSDGEGDGGSGASPNPSASSADVQALGAWCAAEQQRVYEEWAKDPSAPPPEIDHEIDGASLTAAVAAYASGATDIPLSKSRCTRVFVTREGGKVTSETIVRAPFTPSVDPATYAVVYKPASIVRWSYTADGETFAGDYDGDGFDEARFRVTYDKEAVREEHAPANDAVVARTSAVSAGEGLVEVKTEQLVDGALAVTRTVRAPLVQKACNPAQPKPPPPNPTNLPWKGPTRACSPTESDAISKLVSTALQKGSGCLYAAGMQNESDQVLKTYIRGDAKIECIDDQSQGFWAANDGGYMAFHGGKVRLIFNSQLFTQSQSFQEGTVGHELFHFFDVHDADLEAAADESQLRLMDPVYACEYLCFGNKPTTCHLAACQQKKVGTSWKGKSCEGTVKRDDVSKIEKARGDGVTITSCSSGHQVGSICRSKTNGTEVQFCTTDVECAAACAGGSCESKSLSCLPDCR